MEMEEYIGRELCMNKMQLVKEISYSQLFLRIFEKKKEKKKGPKAGITVYSNAPTFVPLNAARVPIIELNRNMAKSSSQPCKPV